MKARVAFGVLLAILSAPSFGQAAPSAPKRWYRDITEAQANELLALVRQAQDDLRGGKDMWFELLSGAPASYEATKISPRDAFLALDVSKATHVESKSTGNPLWQPFDISVPDGDRRPIWKVRVILGINKNIERIEMLYAPPAPF